MRDGIRTSAGTTWGLRSGLAGLGAVLLLATGYGCGDSFVRTYEPSGGAGGDEGSAGTANDGTGALGGGGGDEDGSECEVGAFSCQGQVVLQCQSGTWTQVGTCPLACLGAGECGGECVPDSRDCVDSTPRLCSAEGTWRELEACPEACSGEGNCIGQCIPNSQDCLEGAPRTCSSDGEWLEGPPCPFVCTGAGECAGECAPEDGKCEGNVPYVCHEAGVWIAQPPCEKVCSGKGECGGACKPGDKECSGNKPRTCNDQGEWEDESACEFVCTGAGECTGECAPGTKVCDGYGYKSCNSEGTYVHGECPTAKPVCSGEGVCGGSCVDGTQSIDYDPALVGECCTTAAGTGYLSQSSSNLSMMSCRGIGNDLAHKKTVTASSSFAGYPPSSVNDGDQTTLWKAGTNASNEWVMIDFKSAVTTRGVVFTFEQPGAYGYKVETSQGVTWVNRGTVTSSGEFASEGVYYVSASTRYLRFTFTTVPTGLRAALKSLRVY